jgi:hypothetical protein
MPNKLAKFSRASVRLKNLLSAEFFALQLVKMMNHQSAEGELALVDRENKTIAW